MSPESNDLIIEVVQSLTSLSSPHASEVLRGIKDETDASRVMSVLREKTGALVNRIGTDPAEIETQNSTAYPEKPNSDTNPLGDNTHRYLGGQDQRARGPCVKSLYPTNLVFTY